MMGRNAAMSRESQGITLEDLELNVPPTNVA
jgi:hypothetical protein